jgi:hypothetical protein
MTARLEEFAEEPKVGDEVLAVTTPHWVCLHQKLLAIQVVANRGEQRRRRVERVAHRVSGG